MRPARLVGLVVLALAVLAAGFLLARLRREERAVPLPRSDAAGALHADQAVLAPSAAPPRPETPAGSASDAEQAVEAVEPLVLAILDPDGGPLAGARAVVFDEAHILGEAVTDEAGEARFMAREGKGEVAVWSASAPAHRQALAVLAGRHVIQLERGTAVAGLVLVDGLPPTEPFDLWLESDSQVRPTEFFPPKVRAALGLGLGAFDALRARVGEDGRFRVSGLPVPWSGRLRWEAALCLVDGAHDDRGRPKREMELKDAREDVVLELAAPGVITARFADADGAPLAPDSDRVRLAAPWGTDIAFEHRTGADGAYHGSVQLPLPEELTLTVYVPRAYVARFTRPASAVALWDLGVIVVPPRPELRVRVHDELGRPVAEANIGLEYHFGDVLEEHALAGVLAQLAEGGTRTSTSGVVTDASGTASLQVWENVSRILVQHADYAPAIAPAPDDLNTTVDVTLRRTAQLRLDFLILPAGSGGHLCATLQTAENGAPRRPRRRPTAALESPLNLGLGGIHGLNVVPAGVPLCLRLTDCLGRIVHEELLTPLAPGETVEHKVKLEWEPVTLSLRVLDAGGHPLERAAVLLEGGYRVWTEPDGRVELRALAPVPLTVTVAHPSHAQRTLASILLTAGNEPFDVHLTHR